VGGAVDSKNRHIKGQKYTYLSIEDSQKRRGAHIILGSLILLNPNWFP